MTSLADSGEAAVCADTNGDVRQSVDVRQSNDADLVVLRCSTALEDVAPASSGGRRAACVASVVRHAIRNSRRRMEDRSVVIDDLSQSVDAEQTDRPVDVSASKWPEVVSYYGVFDGHSGTVAAAYCAQNFHEVLASSPHMPQCPAHALADTFAAVDGQYCSDGRRCGTTALVALLSTRQLHVAWAGDSLAVLSRNGRAIPLVHAHRPGRDDERVRIEQLGGFVEHYRVWRVQGVLAVARAIGDVEMKPFVTARPDITRVDLDGSEELLVLGTDGVWDVVSPQEAVDTLLSLTAEAEDDDEDAINEAVRRLGLLAVERGSSDNISIIAVRLKAIGRDGVDGGVKHVPSCGMIHSTDSVISENGLDVPEWTEVDYNPCQPEQEQLIDKAQGNIVPPSQTDLGVAGSRLSIEDQVARAISISASSAGKLSLEVLSGDPADEDLVFDSVDGVCEANMVEDVDSDSSSEDEAQWQYVGGKGAPVKTCDPDEPHTVPDNTLTPADSNGVGPPISAERAEERAVIVDVPTSISPDACSGSSAAPPSDIVNEQSSSDVNTLSKSDISFEVLSSTEDTCNSVATNSVGVSGDLLGESSSVHQNSPSADDHHLPAVDEGDVCSPVTAQQELLDRPVDGDVVSAGLSAPSTQLIELSDETATASVLPGASELPSDVTPKDLLSSSSASVDLLSDKASAPSPNEHDVSNNSRLSTDMESDSKCLMENSTSSPPEHVNDGSPHSAINSGSILTPTSTVSSMAPEETELSSSPTQFAADSAADTVSPCAVERQLSFEVITSEEIASIRSELTHCADDLTSAFQGLSLSEANNASDNTGVLDRKPTPSVESGEASVISTDADIKKDEAVLQESSEKCVPLSVSLEADSLVTSTESPSCSPDQQLESLPGDSPSATCPPAKKPLATGDKTSRKPSPTANATVSDASKIKATSKTRNVNGCSTLTSKKSAPGKPLVSTSRTASRPSVAVKTSTVSSKMASRPLKTVLPSCSTSSSLRSAVTSGRSLTTTTARAGVVTSPRTSSTSSASQPKTAVSPRSGPGKTAVAARPNVRSKSVLKASTVSQSAVSSRVKTAAARNGGGAVSSRSVTTTTSTVSSRSATTCSMKTTTARPSSAVGKTVMRAPGSSPRVSSAKVQKTIADTASGSKPGESKVSPKRTVLPAVNIKQTTRAGAVANKKPSTSVPSAKTSRTSAASTKPAIGLNAVSRSKVSGVAAKTSSVVESGRSTAQQNNANKVRPDVSRKAPLSETGIKASKPPSTSLSSKQPPSKLSGTKTNTVADKTDTSCANEQSVSGGDVGESPSNVSSPLAATSLPSADADTAENSRDQSVEEIDAISPEGNSK